MLDEEHEALPVATSDDNVYVLGSIAGHNVVMTCLRAGVYGLVSATAVGKDVLATFPNVKSTPLLVGIGGGCPSSSHDIRLGDVVVSKQTSELPAVRQYDSGKIVHNGKLEIKGFSNKPAPVLLSAVAYLESKHGSLGQQIQTHMTNAHQRYGVNHAHPGIDLDILFKPRCEHFANGTDCVVCGPLARVSRNPRSSLCPEVHFGPIASGNQVLKDSITRDRLASEHGFLCFEMEAAGLMDFLPCLVIRGICDYCDSFKHKQFQPYAALTAAAFARELISVIPKKISMEEQPDKPAADRLERRRLIMEALDFVEADSRKATIGKAYHQTCRWLFKQQEYINWRDNWKVDGKLNTSNALLWLKGNPGTGKSTIMKFILEDIEKRKSKNDVVISFFFNARGEPLERTIEGLYRSLVVQLLNQLPSLQWLLEKIRTMDSRGNIKMDSVLELFRIVLQTINDRQIICLVDALDECPEQEIRNMLGEFGAIFKNSETVPNFRVLLSSRHYPHISIDVGQSFVLEEQDGHFNDLTKYIHAELKIGKTPQAIKFKDKVLAKANGIFLWVVLVVNILKREHDRGQRICDMARKLEEIPIELNQLFKEILLRDNDNVNGLVLCIQWCLYSQRPLTREEFYFAMLTENDENPIESWDQEETTSDTMDKFILNCSRGLTEMTRGKRPVVQFIHESVREFFLAPDTLLILSSEYHDITQAGAHEKLRNCCYRLISSEALGFLDSPDNSVQRGDAEKWALLRSLSRPYPFFDYAVSFVLHHANKVAEIGQDQTKFLQDFCTFRWTRFYNVAHRSRTHRLKHESLGVLLHLMYERLQPLLTKWLDIHCPNEKDIRLLLHVCVRSKGDDVAKPFLLEHGQKTLFPNGDLNLVRFEILIDLLLDAFWPVRKNKVEAEAQAFAVVHLSQWIWASAVEEVDHEDTRKLIKFAAEMKRSNALELLLNAMHFSKQQLEPEFVQTLLDEVFGFIGRRCESLDISRRERPDMRASLDADLKACIEILTSRGAQIQSVSRPGRIIAWVGLDTLHFLLLQDSLWVQKSFLGPGLVGGGNILHHAILYKRPLLCLQLLLHHGAEVNAKNEMGESPLLYCLRITSSMFGIAQVLINHGAQTDGFDKAKISYPEFVSEFSKIKAMVPQKPCCPLGDETNTVLQASDDGTLIRNLTGRLEQSFDNSVNDDEILETLGTPASQLDDREFFR